MTATAESSATASSEYNDLTDRQRKMVERAATHADDFATRAAEHDRDGSFAFENFEKMHQSGYMRQCLPAAMNGEDATVEELSICQERLAQGDASTALGANMHSFFMGAATEIYNTGDKTWEIPLMAVAHTGMTVGGAISETASSDPFNFPSGTVERVEGGFKLNGRKVFGSNTPINPMLFFNGVLEENGQRLVVAFQIPKGTPGANIIEDWDTMGMRATGSFTIEYKDCVVPEMFKAQEYPAGGAAADNPFTSAFLCWFGPTIAAVYNGISIAARDYARDSLGSRSRLPHGELKHSPAAQFTVAEMYINVEAARAFTRRSAQRLSNPAWRDEEAMALAIATKLFATEHAIKTVDLAMEVSGGGAFFKRSPLERLYRDVRAGTFHPLNRWDGLEAIGKSELKIPARTEPRFR